MIIGLTVQKFLAGRLCTIMLSCSCSLPTSRVAFVANMLLLQFLSQRSRYPKGLVLGGTFNHFEQQLLIIATTFTLDHVLERFTVLLNISFHDSLQDGLVSDQERSERELVGSESCVEPRRVKLVRIRNLQVARNELVCQPTQGIHSH